jgi:hypothetical protein
MPSAIETLTLWKVLKKKATDKQRALVKDLADTAATILDRVIETFPIYTLHDAVHARNVAELMASLLGPALADLTVLEAAILLLSAFWHDIGMVFAPAERMALESERYWPEFFVNKPEALVRYQESGGLTDEIAEWYCRFRHADRVYVYLDREAKRLHWGPISIREALGELCRSHNLDVAAIKTSDALQNNYLEAADLKFCAILLRLADILDFDNSRAPEPVYQMLGIARRAERRTAQSDVEWRKHLASDGFRFPVVRDGRYELGFVAGPTHPAVEHDIRRFLTVIEEQLGQCDSLLPFCHARWQGFALPHAIKRDNIKSDGYCYGEYFFSLDQEQVLNLLMGENLYQDRYVFVRELTQNAIDTSRYREYREAAHGHRGMKVRPIQVTDWCDAEGRWWIRFDDHGMGMDEAIIRNHLLKVASSYYQTAAFRAEIIRARQTGAPDFVPISRFGIGLLSCFIICDRVEISTRHLGADGKPADPIRLSLQGLHGFYTLQTGRVPPLPMPSATGDEPGYRWEAGTSIAVQVDPSKEVASRNLRDLLEQHVFCSPVRIELNGELVGMDFEQLIEKPWCERMVWEFPPQEMARLDHLMSFKFSKPFQVEFVPLDLTKHSPTSEFKGQLLAIVLHLPEEWRRLEAALDRSVVRLSVELGHDRDAVKILFCLRGGIHSEWQRAADEMRKRLLTEVVGQYRDAALHILDRIPTEEDQTRKSGFYRDSYGSFNAFCQISLGAAFEALPSPAGENLQATIHRLRGLVSHNGIVIPAAQVNGSAEFPLDPQLGNPGQYSEKVTEVIEGLPFIGGGAVAFADSLRPELDVTRAVLRKLPLAAYAVALRSLHGALHESGHDTIWRAAIIGWTKYLGEWPSMRELCDAQVLEPFEDWKAISVFQIVQRVQGTLMSRSATVSLQEVLHELTVSGQVNLFPGARTTNHGKYEEGFTFLCGAMLAQLKLNLQANIEVVTAEEGFRIEAELWALPGLACGLLPGQAYFPPLTFVSYATDFSTKKARHFLADPPFAVEAMGINLEHPLARWLLEITPKLVERFPGIFEQLRATLISVRVLNQRRHWSRGSFHSAINELLERLATLDSDLRPPRSFCLQDRETGELGWKRAPSKRRAQAPRRR